MNYNAITVVFTSMKFVWGLYNIIWYWNLSIF